MFEVMYKNIEDARKNTSKWQKRNRIKRNAYQVKYHKNIRKALIELLGGECIRCGFKDIRALQIDHIKGGGRKEYNIVKSSTNYNNYVMKKILNGNMDYQLLCANCNWIKRYENQEYFK